MSPLPSPEERRKRLKSLSLEDVLGRTRRAGHRPLDARHRSAAAEERERQHREAHRRTQAPHRS